MPMSKRLKERETRTVRSEHQRLRELDRDRRREPSLCKQPDCNRPARHQGSLCEEHYDDTVFDKELLPLIYQGCPHFLQSYNPTIAIASDGLVSGGQSLLGSSKTLNLVPLIVTVIKDFLKSC